MKAIAPQFAEDAAFRERFQLESQLAASIEHPNVIPIYEAGELDDLLYLIMRWVDGTDLRQLLIKCDRLSPTTAAQLLIPVALALGAAHRRGLIHRDVKPANVLIAGYESNDQHVYLTDFGIARRTEGHMTITRTGALVGTLDYIAPERIEGGRGDAASDIYSFGCMLYEALTGEVPFDRPTELTKMHAHLNDPVPSARAKVPDVPESLDAIIAKAMAKQPADRFGSADQLARAMTRSLRELSPETVSEPETVPERETLPERETGPERVTLPERETAPEPVPEEAPVVTTGTMTQLDQDPGRHRGPGTRIAALVAVLAIIGVAVVILASGSGGGRPSGSNSSATNASAGVTVPRPGVTGGLQIVNRIALPGAPSAITADASSNRVWVAGTGYVFALPGRTKTPINGTPSAIAAGKGQLWISDPNAGELRRFTSDGGRLTAAGSASSNTSVLVLDPADGSAWTADTTGRIAHVGLDMQFTHGTTVSPPAVALAFGEGSWLWAVNGKQLLRINTGGTTAQPSTFADGSDPVSVALNEGVWTAQGDGHVTRFDPRASVTQSDGSTTNGLGMNMDVAVSAPAALTSIAAIPGAPAVWTLSTQTRTVYRIDYASRKVTGTATFSSTPIGLAVTPSSTWVITRNAQLIQVSG
jgi:hypothetical protein